MLQGWRIQLGNRTVCESQFDLRRRDKVLDVHFEDSDLTLRPEDDYVLQLAKWKIDVRSCIDQRARTDIVLKGWQSLGGSLPFEKAPLDRFIWPFLYSDYLDISRGNYHIPSFLDLIRLAYWHEICSRLPKFYYKQNEIRSHLRPLVANVEKTISEHGKGFQKFMYELRRRIATAESELSHAGMINELGYSVSFHPRHDFIVNDIPCEVKSPVSRTTIRKTQDQVKFEVAGQKMGPIDFPNEVADFIFSKKIYGHLYKASVQGGHILFLDVSRTFLGFVLSSFASLNNLTLTMQKALEDALKLAVDPTPSSVPVMIITRSPSYDYLVNAVTLPLRSVQQASQKLQPD